MAEAVRNPIFTWPQGRQPIIERNPVDFVDLFFHKQLFLSMVEHTNANISDDSLDVDEEEMHCFVGIMFAMTVCPMSNIRDYWNTEDDGLMVACRFFDKLHMSTTACVLRLMEPLAGSGVILHGDSWFASLNTLQKLRAMGIYFVGLIKTAHSGTREVASR